MSSTEMWHQLADPAGASENDRIKATRQIVAASATLMSILQTIKDQSLADGWLVSGGVYQTIWNHITNRSEAYGIKDYDVIYFDGKYMSYEAEDKIIRKVESALPHLQGMLEVRNQARVHLWFEKRFGTSYPTLTCATEALNYYASKTHAVAVRLNQRGEIDVHAPFGLSNIFALKLVPNETLDNQATYLEKAKRMKVLWPELKVMGWGE